MRLFTASNAGLLALVGLLHLPLPGQSTTTPPDPPTEEERSLWGEGDGVFRSCDALFGSSDGRKGVNVSPGSLTFLHPIVCDAPSVSDRSSVNL